MPRGQTPLNCQRSLTPTRLVVAVLNSVHALLPPLPPPPPAPHRSAPRARARDGRSRRRSSCCRCSCASGTGVRQPVSSMPGVSPDVGRRDARATRRAAAEAGVGGVLLFGIPDHKDDEGSRARGTTQGPVQRAVRALKRELPQLVVITDVCMCEYTDHGHCGILRDGEVDNDAHARAARARVAVACAAGADIVAPSDMMDGRVGAIRRALDDGGLRQHGDPELRREVRERVLRTISRGRGEHAADR